jgi:anti-sigma-K factor RskA
MNNKAPHDLVFGYVLDALDPEETELFEEHLSACESCLAELAALSVVPEALGSSMAIDPPSELEAAIMQAVRGAEPVRRLERRPRPRRYLLATAAAVVLFAVGVGVGLALQPDPSSQFAEAMPVVMAPDAQFMPLDIQGSQTRLVVSHEMDTAAVVGTDIPMPADDGVYQVWAVGADGTMSPVGEFQPTSTGHVAMPLEGQVSDASAYMITIEPETGAVHPTTPPIAEVAMA